MLPSKNQNADLSGLICVRLDGLGGRLLALLNTMRLSAALEVPFRFMWDTDLNWLDSKDKQFHALDGAETLFSPEFLDAYCVQKSEVMELELADLPAKEGLVELKQTFHSAPRPYGFNSLDVDAEMAALGVEEDPAEVAALWKQIEFSADVKRAVDLANAAPLEDDTVCMHLRAGDIIQGAERYWGLHTGKVIPVSVAEHIVRHFKEKGQQLLIFGQDKALCSYLAETYGVVLASDLMPAEPLSSAQAALFDMTLISRCSQVIAGASIFAILGAMIGGTKLVRPYAYFRPHDLQQITLSAPVLHDSTDKISNYQRAFAFWYAVCESGHIMTPLDNERFLEGAAHYDPDNPLYELFLATALGTAGRIAEADAAMLNVLTRMDRNPEYRTLCLEILKQLGIGGGRKPVQKRLFDDLQSLVGKDRVGLTAVASVLSKAKGDVSRMEELRTLLQQSSAQGPEVALGTSLLEAVA